MKFKLQASDLIAALDVVSIVTPKPVTPQGGAGYLFVVRGDRCYVYSRDALCVARADFPITEADGEGSFVYPAEYIAALRFLDGHSCVFEAQALEDERFVVRYEASNGAKSERTSFNPALLSTCDDDLNATKTSYDFPAAVLKEAISLSRPFLAKFNDTRTEEQYKALQVFDGSKPDQARGDGHLFAADSVRAFYFWSEAFAQKGLEIHGQHLSALLSFLSKSEEKVVFKMGDHFTFAENAKGHILGWPKHAKTHGKFSYYPLKSDKYVFAVDRVPLLGALQYMRSELDTKRDKIKILFNHERRILQFAISEGTSKAESHSVPVKVKDREVKEGEGEAQTVKTVPWMEDHDWAFSVNIDHLIELVSGVKANQVEFRVLTLPPSPDGRKEVAMFRTIDDFRLDAAGKSVVEAEGSYRCRVTRFMPSKD
jgi:hypothetical protein